MKEITSFEIKSEHIIEGKQKIVAAFNVLIGNVDIVSLDIENGLAGIGISILLIFDFERRTNMCASFTVFALQRLISEHPLLLDTSVFDLKKIGKMVKKLCK